MAYDTNLELRIDTLLEKLDVRFESKKMMGGLCYMVDDKMTVGIIKDMLMARVGPQYYEEALSKPGCREMDFTKRPMKGYVYVDPQVLESDQTLVFWLKKCLEFNPLAQSSKKKKKRP